MMSRALAPVLIIHGGAGVRGPADERPSRQRAMLEAAQRGRSVLESGGSALDAVCAATVILEDSPLFNAGYGSALNSDGDVEMDASLMVVPLASDSSSLDGASATMIGAGAVAGVRRIRNPILAARAVMTETPHVLIIGAAADRLASRCGLAMCRPDELVTDRARARWKTYMGRSAEHGTVGAVALDINGQLAAATSTGGITGKMAGRVGDSAIVGAGTYADRTGAASATGFGEAIMKTTLCREVVRMLSRTAPSRAAAMGINMLEVMAGGEAGIIVVDRRGRIGYAHNAQAMDIATFTPAEGLRHYHL
jgi:beta-aspartyl-peptidase (threonine type)